MSERQIIELAYYNIRRETESQMFAETQSKAQIEDFPCIFPDDQGI
jgi:hypothetical protein